MCDIGIPSGLNVMGHGTVNYTFYNNEGTLKTAMIEHCLYVLHCTARLLCPRQLSSSTNLHIDGFFAGDNNGTLTYECQQMTVQYDALPALPILYTAPGLLSFTRFCAQHGILTHPNDKALSDTTAPPLTDDKILHTT